VQETCTRKHLYKIDRHTYKFLVPYDLDKFLVEVSWACVAGISLSVSVCVSVSVSEYVSLCVCDDWQFPVVAVESDMPIVNPVSGRQYGQLRVALAMGSLEQISAYQRTKAGHASAIAVPERPASHLERCIVYWQSDVVMWFGVVMVERLSQHL